MCRYETKNGMVSCTSPHWGTQFALDLPHSHPIRALPRLQVSWFIGVTRGGGGGGCGGSTGGGNGV